MKKMLIGAGVVASIGQNALAVEGQFPVLKTEKSCQLVVPQGQTAAQIYFSKDCSTAYVLPPHRLKMEVKSPILLGGADDNLCIALKEKLASVREYDSKAKYLEETLDKVLAASDSGSATKQVTIDRLKDQIKYYNDKVRDAVKPYDSMAAMRGKISLSNDVMESIRAFQEANKSAVGEGDRIYPVRFMPAHIVDSVAVISKADDDKYIGRSIVKVNFPGEPAAPVAGVTRDPDAVYVSMNGGLSGIVDISTVAYCANKASGKTMEDVFAQAVAVNLVYKTRVQVGVKIEATASIQTKQFLRNMQNVIRKSKFNRGEFIADMISGGLENSLSVLIDDKGQAYKMAELLNNDDDGTEKSLIAPLLAKFMLNYVTRAEDKLEQLGVFTKGEPLRATEVSEGTEDVKVGERQVCNSSSSLFGLIRSRVCNSYPIIVKMDRDGLSELIQSQQDDSYIQEHISYETNETTTIQHTSEFVRVL